MIKALDRLKKMQNKVKSMSDDLSSISIEQSKKAVDAKRKKRQDRMEYYKIYKRKCRQNTVFKTKERESKQSVRKDPIFRAKETVYQKESKQSGKKKPCLQNKRKRIKAVCKKKSHF